MKQHLFAIGVLLLAAIHAYAGGTTCTTATGLVPDGRVLSLDYVQPGNSTVWYSFGSTAGHSYSVEVRDDLDGNPGTDLAITYWSGNCATQMTALTGPPYTANQYRDTSAIDPKIIPNTGMRVSIPNPNTDTIAIRVVNSGSLGHYISVSVSETTLVSTAWLTSGNYNTYYAWVNSTSATINGTLNFWDSSTGALAPPSPISLSLPPNGTSNNTGTWSLPRNKYGAVYYTHDGPPGSIEVTAIAADFTTTPPATQEYKFAPLREAAH